jgi:hypothetical protein
MIFIPGVITSNNLVVKWFPGIAENYLMIDISLRIFLAVNSSLKTLLRYFIANILPETRCFTL